MSTTSAGPPGFKIPEEMQEVMAAVGATLATAQLLELTLIALVLMLDKRHDLGRPIEDMATRARTLREDPLGNLITKLQQVSGASPADLQELRHLNRRRSTFAHSFCATPSFVSRSGSEAGRRELLQELWDLSCALEATRREAAQLTLQVTEDRFGITVDDVLEDLRGLAEGTRESSVLDADMVELLREPGMLERAEGVVTDLVRSSS